MMMLTILALAAFGGQRYVQGEGLLIKTGSIEKAQSVYLGAYLANGHLPARETYRIGVPVDGIVTFLGAHVNEPVKKGERLATLKSQQLLALESEYIDALIEKEYYAHQLERLEPLSKSGTVARKHYFEAKNSLQKYEAKSGYLRKLLIEWGVKPEVIEKIAQEKKPVATLDINAPVSGKISEIDAKAMMYLQRGEPLMTLIDPKKVHLEVSLPLELAKSLKPGEKLYIDKQPVTVESIAPTVETRTQTVAVHLLIPGASTLMPGEKRNVKLYRVQSALSLPASALVDLDGAPAIFVKTPQGYAPHAVRLLSRTNTDAYFDAPGVKAGDTVAVTGVIALKGAYESSGSEE